MLVSGMFGFARMPRLLQQRTCLWHDFSVTSLRAHWSYVGVGFGPQVVMLLRDQHSEEAGNELLQTKLFALVMGGLYRSHADALFQYCNGSWVRTGSITAYSLEWLLGALRQAHAYFILMASAKACHLPTLECHAVGR